MKSPRSVEEDLGDFTFSKAENSCSESLLRFISNLVSKRLINKTSLS